MVRTKAGNIHKKDQINRLTNSHHRGLLCKHGNIHLCCFNVDSASCLLSETVCGDIRLKQYNYFGLSDLGHKSSFGQ